MPEVERVREFNCVECGRHIVRFVSSKAEPDLCAQCIFLPGWFRDPRIRDMLDSEHDGREAMDAIHKP